MEGAADALLVGVEGALERGGVTGEEGRAVEDDGGVDDGLVGARGLRGRRGRDGRLPGDGVCRLRSEGAEGACKYGEYVYGR